VGRLLAASLVPERAAGRPDPAASVYRLSEELFQSLTGRLKTGALIADLKEEYSECFNPSQVG
jgi:hypothetical protein